MACQLAEAEAKQTQRRGRRSGWRLDRRQESDVDGGENGSRRHWWWGAVGDGGWDISGNEVDAKQTC